MNQVTNYQPRPPLPESWVRKLFAELHGNYGQKWIQMWATGEKLPDGSDAGVKLAMAVWAEKLAGFADKPEAIKGVLANLPEQVPTLPKFIEMCRDQAKRHKPAPLMLEDGITEEQAAKNRQRISEMVQNMAREKVSDGNRS